MKLLAYSPEFFEDIVGMFYDMTKEIYKGRRIGYKQAFYRDVDEWTSKHDVDVILVVSDKDVIGFSKSFVSNNSGLYEPHYFTDYIYIKPEYRNTKAITLLSNNILEYGDELKMANIMNVRTENGFDKSLRKYMSKQKTSYNITDSFITLEKRNTDG